MRTRRRHQRAQRPQRHARQQHARAPNPVTARLIQEPGTTLRCPQAACTDSPQNGEHMQTLPTLHACRYANHMCQGFRKGGAHFVDTQPAGICVAEYLQSIQLLTDLASAYMLSAVKH